MVCYALRSTTVKAYFFIAYTISALQIDKLVVPDLVQSGLNVVLDCQYSVPDDHVTVQWLRGDTTETTIYQWSPHTMPIVAETFKDRLDLSFRISRFPSQERRAIRILGIEPEMSGKYTCVVIHDGVRTRMSKNMQVFSPEKDIDLIIDRVGLKSYQINCSTREVYPQPDLILEYNGTPVSQQWQRVWRSKNNLFYAETKAYVSPYSECEDQVGITCRLSLPSADYTAITKKFIYFGTVCNDAWMWCPMPKHVLLLLMAFIYCNLYVAA